MTRHTIFRGLPGICIVAAVTFSLSFTVRQLAAQCTATVQFPQEQVRASQFNDTVVVTTQQNAGQFYVIRDLALNRTYAFTSSNPGDYITIRDQDGVNFLAGGTSPVQYTISGDDIVTVHINLLSPPCASDAIDRTTTVVCTDCPALPPAIGIETSSPKARLDVNGEIRVGDVVNPPVAGVIRWNPDKQDFEGYDGTKWKSFTKSLSSWGTVPSNLGQENQRLLGETGGSAGDRFGQAVSISGNYAVIGAISGDNINGNEGAAYIFRLEGSAWIEDTVLYASDGGSGDRFGGSVDIDGDYIVIGAESNDAGGAFNRGAAYVFKRSGNTWDEQQKLTASDGASFDVFGVSVAISGDRIIVGADGADPNNQGAAYVYKRDGNTWTEEDILTAQNGGADDRFGISVDIDGMYAVVGAYLDDIGTVSDQGSAYVFFRTGSAWSQQQKLTASDGDAFDRFGVSVAISDSTVVIGADEPFTASEPGAAYVFTGNTGTWTQQTRLSDPQGEIGDAFGYAVDISGNYILVGSYKKNVNGNEDQGAAFFYELTEGVWKQTTQLVASDGSAADFFGVSVAVSGNCALVGADSNTSSIGLQQGSAYFFFK